MKATLLYCAISFLLCCILTNAAIAQGQTLVSDYNGFGFDLHRATAQGHANENLVCSPWGVANVLGMLHAGASDEAAAEIDAVFDFSEMRRTQPDFLANIPQLFRNDQPPERRVKLVGANSAWFNNGFEALPEYTDDIAKHYHAAINTLPFNRPAQAVGRINSWSASKTNRMIPKIVTEDDFDPALQQQLMLLNAIYFNGRWQLPFSPRTTRKETFHLADGTTMRTNMMSQTDSFDYHAGQSYQAVRLDYSGGASMILLLPDEDRTLAEMEAKLDAAGFALVCKNLKPRPGTVKIPRFGFESGDSSLIPAMQSLGIQAIFDGGENHLTKIDGTASQFFVSLMRQKAMIRVDEKGTVAAAATMSGMGYGGRDNAMPFEFTADRPFLFVICENTTGTILFIGRVHEPEKAGTNAK